MGVTSSQVEANRTRLTNAAVSALFNSSTYRPSYFDACVQAAELRAGQRCMKKLKHLDWHDVQVTGVIEEAVFNSQNGRQVGFIYVDFGAQCQSAGLSRLNDVLGIDTPAGSL